MGKTMKILIWYAKNVVVDLVFNVPFIVGVHSVFVPCFVMQYFVCFFSSFAIILMGKGGVYFNCLTDVL